MRLAQARDGGLDRREGLALRGADPVQRVATQDLQGFGPVADEGRLFGRPHRFCKDALDVRGGHEREPLLGAEGPQRFIVGCLDRRVGREDLCKRT
jgi:hypothetical protein